VKAHPLAPAVRWAVFPALAGLAAGLAAGAWPVKPEYRLAYMALYATLGAGAALGAVLSARLWVLVPAAVPMALAAGCVGVSLALWVVGTPVPPARILEMTLKDQGDLRKYAGVAGLLVAAHAAALRVPARRFWPVGLALYAGAALVTLVLTFDGHRGMAAGPLLIQILPLRACVWISDRTKLYCTHNDN
jgi:hypothetical protein